MHMWSGVEGISEGLVGHQNITLVVSVALTLYPLLPVFVSVVTWLFSPTPTSCKNGAQG